jgi:hypothetical protein
LQLVHDPGAHLDHAMAMPQQLPHIAIVPARNPDLGKVILQQELQNAPHVLAIGLLPQPTDKTPFGSYRLKELRGRETQQGTPREKPLLLR